MLVTVHYLAQLRRAAGCFSEVVADFEGGTLAEVLHLLASKKSPEFHELLFGATGKPKPTWLFFVDDDQATLATQVRDGAQITILAPMAGGSGGVNAKMHELGIDRWSFEDRLALLQELWQSVSLPANPFPPPEAETNEARMGRPRSEMAEHEAGDDVVSHMGANGDAVAAKMKQRGEV